MKKPQKAKPAKAPARSTRPAARAATIPSKKHAAPPPHAPARTAAKAKPATKSKPAPEAKSRAPVVEAKKASSKLVRPMDARNGAAKPITPPAIVQAPIPTDGKPRKNQAGLGVRELDHFRELLLAKRRELLGDMSSMEREALRSTSGTNLSNLPIHMADMGTDNYEQEFTLGLVEKDRQLLREINTALAKLQDGTYGLCEGTGKPISKERLEAQPWAKHSIEYARELEKRGIRR